jgi:hypothetical protein
VKPEKALREILRQNRKMKKLLADLRPHIGWQATSNSAKERNERIMYEIDELFS